MKDEWATKTLGELCRFIDYRGKTPEKTASGLRLITAKNVKMGYLQATPMEFVAPESYESWMTRGIPVIGDVLFTTEAPLANVAQLDTNEKVVFAQRIIVMQPKANNLDRTFLRYLLMSDVAQNRILERGTGATVQGIKASLLKAILIEFPPLAEQQRIVGLLDEAFEGLATAKAKAEQNLQNARALFESHLQSVFTQRGAGWVETTLSDEVDFAAGYAFKSAGYVNAVNGTRLLRGDNIMQGEFRWEDAAYWPSDDTLTYDRFRLEENDIVLAMDRPWVAAGLKIACVSKGDLPCLQVQRTARLRASKSLSWRYLFHLLRSQEFVSYLLEGQTGLGVPHISGKQILSFRFSRPSLAEQKQIVEKLDALSDETQNLARIYQQKLAALDSLKKSLLHQAFSGAL